MRKHIFLSAFGVIVLLSLIVGPSFAGGPKYRAQGDLPLTPKRAVLHMFQKNDIDGGWLLNRRAASGNLIYRLWGETFEYFFQGRHLQPEVYYVLIYLPDQSEWTHSGPLELGRERSDKKGRLYMAGSVDTCDMPLEEAGSFGAGARMLLLPADEMSESGQLYMEPEQGRYLYLEGFHTIRFMDTDGCSRDADEGGGEEEPYYEVPEEPADQNPEEDEPGSTIPIVPY